MGAALRPQRLALRCDTGRMSTALRTHRHRERHRLGHAGWLRAAVLGANDGLVSTASLLVGVAASGAGTRAIVVAGSAALVAGALSMAAGEYVSVSSQADTERADIARERGELAADDQAEHAELAGIYRSRGLSAELADEVARQMMAHDALGAHMRDELGITEQLAARPMQAALASAASFAAGALPPLAVAALVPPAQVLPVVGAASLAGLAVLGVASARTGGAPVGPATRRVLLWGAAAMLLTAAAGHLFGAQG